MSRRGTRAAAEEAARAIGAALEIGAEELTLEAPAGRTWAMEPGLHEIVVRFGDELDRSRARRQAYELVVDECRRGTEPCWANESAAGCEWCDSEVPA